MVFAILIALGLQIILLKALLDITHLHLEGWRQPNTIGSSADLLENLSRSFSAISMQWQQIVTAARITDGLLGTLVIAALASAAFDPSQTKHIWSDHRMGWASVLLVVFATCFFSMTAVVLILGVDIPMRAQLVSWLSVGLFLGLSVAQSRSTTRYVLCSCALLILGFSTAIGNSRTYQNLSEVSKQDDIVALTVRLDALKSGVDFLAPDYPVYFLGTPHDSWDEGGSAFNYTRSYMDLMKIYFPKSLVIVCATRVQCETSALRDFSLIDSPIYPARGYIQVNSEAAVIVMGAFQDQ